MLTDTPPHLVHQQVVDGAAELVDAENASLLLRDPFHHRPQAVAAVGPAASQLLRGEVPIDHDVLAGWTTDDQPRLLPAAPLSIPAVIQRPLGSGLIVPFPGPSAHRGMIVAYRSSGRTGFDDREPAILESLSRQIATRGELATGRP